MERTSLSVQIADTPAVALNAIESNRLEAAVLDLAMADLRAWELLCRLAARQPDTGLVLIAGAARPTSDLLHALGIDGMLVQRSARNAICSAAYGAWTATARVARTCVLAALIHQEEVTCALGVGDAGDRLVFSKGALVDATAGGARGDEAASALLRVDGAALSVSSVKEPVTRSIRTPVEKLVSLAIERSRRAAPPKPAPPAPAPPPPAAAPLAAARENTPAAVPSFGKAITQEKNMALEQHLQQLKDIKGYKASGIMHFTGDMLVSDSVDPNINLAMVGATFNDIFRSAHEASKKIGLDACRETVIITPKGLIVMACSGVESKAHVHLIGILSADGNSSLMKMQLAKLLPEIVGELA